mmetsp:Transcript_41398/g.70877  ORF Transcript_41398/g.70877 Transcript_41398/m.70877 type:complete len:105 (-) Transcript_41398:289-603(-)|eukprot:CAMPEP_0183743680 /NCGR_PEP_ID=MMETSP0737-20130205/65344_1 /TAXON_ID=385413 /ORGANISM="Thalassiosira miniscula, Strain CCMP1093" /LENGTH=104 /DNA_ID=CAMNT_0025979305 /DNA_START=810 /DNA_END=1124 /DNA_ORIENTATION=+
MKNPVNRLATAAPRALDSLLGGNTKEQQKNPNQQLKRERTCSFDLDLSGLNLDSSSASVGTSVGGCGSIAEEGSVVTFEELSEFSSLEWNADGSGVSSGTPSPN